jgi:hypothetical protein
MYGAALQRLMIRLTLGSLKTRQIFLNHPPERSCEGGKNLQLWQI